MGSGSRPSPVGAPRPARAPGAHYRSPTNTPTYIYTKHPYINTIANKQIIQTHHISYDPEITTKIYKGEHWAITILNRRKKNMSKGFLKCLQQYIKEHQDHAIDLDNEETNP